MIRCKDTERLSNWFLYKINKLIYNLHYINLDYIQMKVNYLKYFFLKIKWKKNSITDTKRINYIQTVHFNYNSSY